MRWDQSLTRRQRLILLTLAFSVVSVISLLAWSIWATLGAAMASPIPTPPPTPASSPTPLPTADAPTEEDPAPTPTPSPPSSPAFDVFRAGIISADVADARRARAHLDTPLTLVDELDMSRALYSHYKAQPALAEKIIPIFQAMGLWEGKLPRINVVTQAEDVASLYAPESAELYLRRDWDGALSTIETQLAYGYAYAFTHGYGDLATLQAGAGSLDHQLALAAVAKGDAVVSTWLLRAVMPAEPAEMPDAASDILHDIALAACPQWREDGGELLQAISCLDLDLGIAFASSRYWSGGTAAMDAVVVRPPRSTEQLLHPDRYSEVDEPRILSPIVPVLDAAWSLTKTETLGEALMGLVIAGWSEGELGADAVTGWGGDLLQVWDGPEGSKVVAWQMDWDDSRTAALFQGQLLELMPHALVKGLIRDTTPPAALTRGRWWSGRQGTIFLYRRANHVWLVWGDSPEAVEAVAVAALP